MNLADLNSFKKSVVLLFKFDILWASHFLIGGWFELVRGRQGGFVDPDETGAHVVFPLA